MQVILTQDVHAKMMAYVDNCKDEISGLGKLTRDEHGNFMVIDLALFEQDVSAAHSDITAEQLAKFQVELIRKGDSLEDWCFWWHSHAGMDVFFSATDTGTIDSSTEFRYLVSLVTNHRHQFVARVDTYEPVRLHAPLDVTVEAYSKDLSDEVMAEITQKVKTRPVVSSIYDRHGTYNNRHGVGFGNGVRNGVRNPTVRSGSFTPTTIPWGDDEFGNMEPIEHKKIEMEGLEEPPKNRVRMSITQIEDALADPQGTDEYYDAIGEAQDQIEDYEELKRDCDDDATEKLCDDMIARLRGVLTEYTTVNLPEPNNQ